MFGPIERIESALRRANAKVGCGDGQFHYAMQMALSEIPTIRQQAADIASRDAVIAACAEAVGASVSPGCSDEFRAMLPAEIRAKLKARDVSGNPGVAGLAQLGRNAIERVAELERELAAVTAERDAANAYASELNDSLIAVNAESVALEAERDQLRAFKAAIDAAPTVAVAVHVYTDRGPYKYLNFAEHDIPASGVELIARPSKESTQDRTL